MSWSGCEISISKNPLHLSSVDEKRDPSHIFASRRFTGSTVAMLTGGRHVKTWGVVYVVCSFQFDGEEESFFWSLLPNGCLMIF